MYPLNDNCLIAVIKIAQEIRIEILLMCLVIPGNVADYKFVVCVKRLMSNDKKIDWRWDTLNRDTFTACFKIASSRAGKICERCRKGVTEFRKTGRSFLNVSMIYL